MVYVKNWISKKKSQFFANSFGGRTSFTKSRKVPRYKQSKIWGLGKEQAKCMKGIQSK